LRPFDEQVSCDNINQYLNAPLLKKLPANYDYSRRYPGHLYHSEASHLPRLSSVVNIVMDPYVEKPDQEMETSFNVKIHMHKMINIAKDFISDCKLEWADNNKMKDFTTTTIKKGVQPDVTIIKTCL
jgi:hypothetical protein